MALSSLRQEVLNLKERLDRFVEEECRPAEQEFDDFLRGRHGEARFAAVPPCVERLKARAKQLGLWNLFLPSHLIDKVPDRCLCPSISLTHREYAILCETLGRCPRLAPEACNSSAPDTGNMEVLLEFGSKKQQEDYLIPLLRGESRSTFLMTEPDVASSDPTNLRTTLTKVNDKEYRLNGRKWWSTGVLDPRCRCAIVVTKSPDDDRSSSKHQAHTMLVIPLPNPGVTVVRPLMIMGYDDAPFGHGEVVLDNVKVTKDNILLDIGQGFRIAQARLGPGRIHHCMRAIGMAQRSYELLLQRSLERQTFGKYLAEHGMTHAVISESYSDLQMARLMTLSCAQAIDEVGARASRDKIAALKVVVPRLTLQVVDRAIQLHGGAGMHDDLPLACFLAGLRSLRIADGPDEVHQRTLARLELRKALHAQTKL